MTSAGASSIDEVDFVYVRDCIRATQKLFGCQSAKVAAQKLLETGALLARQQQPGSEGPLEADAGFTYNAALNWIRRHPIDRKAQPHVARAALALLNTRRRDVREYLKEQNPELADRLEPVLARYLEEPTVAEKQAETPPRRAYADTVFENWKRPYHSGPTILMPGIYQIFRRYKPTRPPASISAARKANYDWSNVATHEIICELIYFDSVNMEAVLVTSERNKYFGSIFIDHDKVLFGLLQRKTIGRPGVNHRLFATTLHSRRYPFYSAIMLKIGDTSFRPIASDCLVVMIPRAEHTDLYDQFDKEQMNEDPVPKDSVIADYLTATPPSHQRHPNWARVRRVRDFPKWNSLTRPSKEHLPIFREPLRTIHHLTIEDLARKGILIDVFKQQDVPMAKPRMAAKAKRKVKRKVKRRK